MSKFNQIKIELAKLIAKLGEVKTDKAVLTYAEDELSVGIYVYVEDSEGNYVAPEDGEYVDESGNRIVVKDGVVDAINPEVELEEEPVKEDPIEGLRKEVNELYDIVDTLIKKVSEIDTKKEESLRQVNTESVEKEIKNYSNFDNMLEGLRQINK